MTLTGEQPWLDGEKSFEVIPYWSFDDKTYEQGAPIKIKGPKASTQEQAEQCYVRISDVVNQQVTFTVEKIKSWDDETTGEQALGDVQGLDQRLDERSAT